MAKERSVDEYLGFAHAEVEKPRETGATSTVVVSDHGAYEDSWYQVLKAKAEEDGAGRADDGGA